MTRPEKDDRVLIIGAGAAGLSVAHRLAQRGFRRVTVLEASDRVGGKCWTVSHGDRWYEMGAIGFPGWKNPFRSLAVAHGVRPTATWTYSFNTARGSRPVPRGISLRLPWQALRLAASLASLQEPGYVKIERALSMPMEKWLSQNGLQATDPMIRSMVTGLGYGFFHDIGAAYALKHVALFRPDVYQLLDGGSQRVWERLSNKLDVRLDHAAIRVERGGRGGVVAVHTKRGPFYGDWLVVATPPRNARDFLQESGEETQLLQRFRCFRYHVLLCDVTGLPDVHYGFFPDAYGRLESGRPVAYSRRYPRAKETMVYTYLDADASGAPESIAAQNEEHLRQFGARMGAIHKQHTWEYFPHVECGDLEGGFFGKLDAMQGQDHIFYVGEALAYPTVRHVIEHAFDTVDRFF